MKPTVTIDLQEYNELLEARRKLMSGMKITTFDVHKTQDEPMSTYVPEWVMPKRITVGYTVKTNDDAINDIAKELKKAQNELAEIDKIHRDDILKVKIKYASNVADIQDSQNEEIIAIKKMSLFEFYRFKHNK